MLAQSDAIGETESTMFTGMLCPSDPGGGDTLGRINYLANWYAFGDGVNAYGPAQQLVHFKDGLANAGLVCRSVGGHLDARDFDQRDLKLFRTLATRTTVILENSRMERSIARLTELQEQLTHQAYHDLLTDLANRTLFGQHIDTALARSVESASSVAVIFLDIDDFKGINDTLGHGAGDALLVEVAARIRSCLRRPDTAARLGGDEFAVLMEGVDSVIEAEHVARRVLETLRRPFVLSGNTITVRASLGIAVADNMADNATSLMRHADVAMYAAKGSGRDRYTVFAPGMESDVVYRRQLRGELERAMEEEQFVLHYQPVVNLITGEISAVEALVRWRHPTRGIVAPGEFIHVAEESHLILPLGAFVLRTACTTALRLQQECPQETPLSVCVNVSVIQLNSATFVQDVLGIVKDVGLPPETLVLELTELMLLEDTAMVSAKLEALRRKGIRIAIDDFGTGYSSLSYLRRLPVDILKIAKPFVDDLGSGADEDFTRAIVSLAEALQVQVIAEGIEAAAQVARLLQLGCLCGTGLSSLSPAAGKRDRATSSQRRHRSQTAQGRAGRGRQRRAAAGAPLMGTTVLAVLVVAIIAIGIGAVAWVTVRRELTSVGFLHSASVGLLEARDLEAASVDLLRRATAKFDAECAELTLIPEQGSPAAFRTTLRGSEPVDVMSRRRPRGRRERRAVAADLRSRPSRVRVGGPVGLPPDDAAQHHRRPGGVAARRRAHDRIPRARHQPARPTVGPRRRSDAPGAGERRGPDDRAQPPARRAPAAHGAAERAGRPRLPRSAHPSRQSRAVHRPHGARAARARPGAPRGQRHPC